MKTYKLAVCRTIRVVSDIFVEGDSPEDAKTRFQHQLESEQCSGIEDPDTWAEPFYYCVDNGNPYDSDYEVVAVDESDD